MIKKILPYLLSFAIILSAFSPLPLSAAVSAGNLRPVTIADGYSSDGWYRTYPGGAADTSTRYIEIAEDGADDVGSLHFVNSGKQGDMRVNIIKNIPAGEYTLKFKIKGSREYSTESLYFANSSNDEGLAQLIPGEKSYPNWTELTVPFKTVGGNTFGFFFSQYNRQTSIYIDNFKVLDASGNDMLDGAGNFCTEGTGEKTNKMQQPYDSETEDYWYRTWLSGTDTSVRFIEISEPGCDDEGSLHIVNKPTEKQGDMRVGFKKTIPAGAYTLQFNIKGSLKLADQQFYFKESGQSVYADLISKTSYPEWEKVELPFTSKGGSIFGITVSQYNWETDIYIDNFKILDSEGNDVLDGMGNFDRLASGGDEPDIPEDVLTLHDSSTANSWYKYSDGTYTAIRKAEIVGDGCFDNGALHIRNVTQGGDIRVCVNKTVPAGEYTLKANIKGKKGVLSEAFYFSSLSDTGNSFTFFNKNTYADWTEVTSTFKTNGGSDFIIFFSQYNGDCDIYLDNLRIIDKDGNDMLDGLGSFCTDPAVGEQAEGKITPSLISGNAAGLNAALPERALIGELKAADGAVLLNGKKNTNVKFKAYADGSMDISYSANEGDILSLDGDFTDNYYKKHIGPASFRYSGGKWENLLTADKAEFYFFETLIENSGFTSGIDGWEQNSLPAGSKDTISSETAGYDGAALRVTHSKASGDSVYKVRTSKYIPVTAGATYKLRLYVKASGNMRLGASLRGNGSSAVPAESGLNTAITNSTDGWQQMNYTFTLPQDATLTGVKVQLDNAFYSSDAEILYDSIAFYRVCEPGDVNADGSLDILDMIRFKKVRAGIAEYTSPNAADINGNGYINTIDAAMIKRLLLGLTDYGSVPEVAMIAPDTAYPYNDQAKAYLTAENPTVDDYAVLMTDSAQDIKIVLECPVEGAKFKVEYGTRADYSDAVTVNTTGKSIAVNNLLRNTKYYVRITATANGITRQAESSFKTADIGPRVMTVGGITNVRDLGGYETSFGKTTLQGLAFRGAQLDIKGTSRLTAQGAELLGTDIALGLEIDLRTASETGGLTKSIVTSAKYLNSRIGSYTAAFSSDQKELFRQIFASYADVNNYPIYVHCVYGADRTGTVCYILNALLGVDEKTLIQDYEFTTFSDAGLRSAATNAEMKAFLTSFNALSGSTPAEKAENYLLSIGVTNEEISTIRGIFFGEIPIN